MEVAGAYLKSLVKLEDLYTTHLPLARVQDPEARVKKSDIKNSETLNFYLMKSELCETMMFRPLAETTLKEAKFVAKWLWKNYTY